MGLVTINDCPAHQGIETTALQMDVMPCLKHSINDCPAHQGIETDTSIFILEPSSYPSINDCPAHQGIETVRDWIEKLQDFLLSMTAPLIRGLKPIL